MSNIVGLCGSLRKGSFNRKLLNEALRFYGRCDYTEILLDLPLYNGDRETEPDALKRLKIFQLQ
jgi:chromate reductase, NAD(P)H dehydrogenase (quinone)